MAVRRLHRGRGSDPDHRHRHIYEWLAGGFFLVNHVDVVIGGQPVQAIELIGEYDPTTDSFTGRAYDNQGNITIMRARVDDQGVWTFAGGGDVAVVARPSTADAGGVVRSMDGHDFHSDAITQGCPTMLLLSRTRTRHRIQGVLSRLVRIVR
jgi:hypothetical protein